MDRGLKFSTIETIIRAVEEGKQVVLKSEEFVPFLVEIELMKITCFMRAHSIYFGRAVVLTKFDAELKFDEEGNPTL